MPDFELIRAPYAVRADYDARVYYVYEIASGKNLKAYRYKTESERGHAAGLSNIVRKEWNERARKGWKP